MLKNKRPAHKTNVAGLFIACVTPSTRGIDVAPSKCGIVLEEALRRYQAVAADADQLVERLRVSQGWGNVVLESQVQD